MIKDVEHNNYVTSALCGYVSGGQTCGQRIAKLGQSDKTNISTIIVGPKGIGKTMLALRFAFAMLMNDTCTDEYRTQLLDSLCKSEYHAIAQNSTLYRQFIKLTCSDFLLISDSFEKNSFEKKKRTSISIEEIRYVSRFLSLSSMERQWKVVIIDGVDAMSRGAADALLKVLEEPGKNTIIILVAHCISQISPTIRSRCCILRATPLSYDDFCTALQKRTVVGIESDMAHDNTNAVKRKSFDATFVKDGILCDENNSAYNKTVAEYGFLYKLTTGNIALALKYLKMDVAALESIIEQLLDGKGTSKSLDYMWQHIANGFTDTEKNSVSDYEVTKIVIDVLQVKLRERLTSRIQKYGIESTKTGEYLYRLEQVRHLMHNVLHLNLDIKSTLFAILAV